MMLGIGTAGLERAWGVGWCHCVGCRRGLSIGFNAVDGSMSDEQTTRETTGRMEIVVNSLLGWC